MKKRCLILALAVAAALFGGCGKDAGGEDARRPRERESREESDYGHEESAPNTTEESEESTEKPLLSSVYASAKPGNEFQFGTYEQDNSLSNGAEPIEWVVLANEGDKILVVSKYVLVGKLEKNREIRDDNIPGASSYALNWEVSMERKWLNNIFYEDAFSDEERSYILQSKITTPDTKGKWKGRYDQPFHTYGGPDTMDYLFSLSYEEFVKYVKPLRITMAEATAASGLSADSETGCVGWLLRSPGLPGEWEDDYAKTSTGYSEWFAKINCHDGDVYWLYDGAYRFQDGRLNQQTGLRMAMWLKVE